MSHTSDTNLTNTVGNITYAYFRNEDSAHKPYYLGLSPQNSIIYWAVEFCTMFHIVEPFELKRENVNC